MVPRLTTDRPQPGARVLRRHPAPVLRDPDGSAIGDRHHRHARRRRRHARSPTRTATSCSGRSTPASTCATPLTTDDIISERCGVRPLVVKTSGRQHRRRRLDVAQSQARHRDRPQAAGRHHLRRQAHRLPERRRRGRRGGRVTRRPAREGPAQLVRRAGQGHPRRVLPAGPADEARLVAHQARHRTTHRSVVAPVRASRVLDARGHPRRPAHGRGHHGQRRLPARRAAPRRHTPR